MIHVMHRHAPTRPLVACIVALAAAATAAAEWPAFRGDPLQHGRVAEAVIEDPELLWTHATGGPVLSTAAIADGRVYVGSDDGRLHCLELATGKVLWTFDAGKPVQSPPLVHRGRVFFGAHDGVMRCVSAADGALQWTFATGDKIIGGANLDARNNRIVFGSYDSKLYALDAETGKLAWEHTTDNYINGTPAILGERTIVGGCDGFVHRVELATGVPQPPLPVEAYIAGSAAVDRDRAWLGHYGNRFICVDLTAGKIAWEYGPREFAFFSSPALDPQRDIVVFGGRDRRVHAARASDGTPLWEFRTRGKVDASPVIAGDKVVAASEDGRVYLLKLDDGSEVWSYLIGQPLVASPAVSDGRIVIGSEDGRVYCFGPPADDADPDP